MWRGKFLDNDIFELKSIKFVSLSVSTSCNMQLLIVQNQQFNGRDVNSIFEKLDMIRKVSSWIVFNVN